MALGLVTAGLGIAQSIGGLAGGGGPRQPRMSGQEKQQMKQQADQQRMMMQMMQMMTQMMGQMQNGMGGNQCGNPNGRCCQQGMNGANCMGGPGGFPQNPMGNMFNLNLGNLPPGTNVNINMGGGHGGGMPFGGNHFGGGNPFGGNFGGFPSFNALPQMGLNFSAGINMSMFA